MSAPRRFAIVHGHFYQPPREDPWLERVPRERGAAPFHDWNERITAECYAPNAAARVLDGAGRIVRLDNNYRRMSFNIGPTLLSWLEAAAPGTYHGILAADRDSATRCGGHGNAMAQAYGHAILPLASPRDRRTQVRWGLADFARRFGRSAEGMWLPETAVDLGSLAALAAEGVRFTVLAPHQAARVRPIGADAAWRDVGDGGIDPGRAYRCALPDGESIAIFFYDAPLARAVAFDGVLHDGHGFADRILASFRDGGDPELVHLATDGESYGHHHRFGDMALASALDRLAGAGVVTTNYAAFLAEHPPRDEVEILERTSWSCAHGVERWRANCGCRADSGSGGDQEWRVGLRTAFDALAAGLDDWFEAEAGAVVGDPWRLRDDLGAVLADPSRRHLPGVLARHAGRAPTRAEEHRLAIALEAQRARLLMFTSCGWFFDEVTGLESTQVMRYAARAIELAGRLGFAPPPEFLDALATARTAEPGVPTAADWFRDRVAPGAITSRRLAVAAAVQRLVGVDDGFGRRPPLSLRIDPRLERSGRDDGEPGGRAGAPGSGLLAGIATVADARTLDEDLFVVAAARQGGFDVSSGAVEVDTPARAEEVVRDLVEALAAADGRGAHGTVVAEISRRLGPEVFGLDVLGIASRAAFLPAVVREAATLVAARLAELVPLARAIAHETARLGLALPPVVGTILGVASGPEREERADADVLAEIGRVEEALRAAMRAGQPPGEDALDALRPTIAETAAAIERGEAAGSFARLQPAREALWWRVWARPGVPAALLEALAPLRDALGFAAEAPAAAAREAAFAALLRTVAEVSRPAPPGTVRIASDAPAADASPA